jgi:hypothetical protein
MARNSHKTINNIQNILNWERQLIHHPIHTTIRENDRITIKRIRGVESSQTRYNQKAVNKLASILITKILTIMEITMVVIPYLNNSLSNSSSNTTMKREKYHLTIPKSVSKMTRSSARTSLKI